MKSKILVTLLLGFISMACFSQENQNFENDSSTFALKSNPLQNYIESFDFGTNELINKLPGIENYFKVPELNFKSESYFDSNRSLSENQNSFNNMPYLKPEINSRMPILVPDSTIDYKLLIKKYNQVIIK